MGGGDFSDGFAALAFFSIPIVWLLAHYGYATVKAWQETALKRDMVARGYTASEIIDVIKCLDTDRSPLSDVKPAKPVKQPV